MAGTFLRFDFKPFLIIWLIAVSISAVLKLADAPNIYTVHFWLSAAVSLSLRG